jgi:hypothetical protein
MPPPFEAVADSQQYSLDWHSTELSTELRLSLQATGPVEVSCLVLWNLWMYHPVAQQLVGLTGPQRLVTQCLRPWLLLVYHPETRDKAVTRLCCGVCYGQ